MELYALVLLAVWGQGNAVDARQLEYLTLMQRGRAEYRSGHFSKSEQLFTDALAYLQKSDETQRAATLADLGDVYASESDLPEAERVYSEGLSIYRRLSDKSGSALMLHNLGLLYSVQGQNDAALKVLMEAMDLLKSAPQPDVSIVVEVLNGIGIVYYRQGKNSKAETVLNQALKLNSVSGSADTASLLNTLGDVYLAQHKFKKAEDILKQALRVKEIEVGSLHPDLIVSLCVLGFLYTEMKRFAEAEDQYQRAVKILEPHEWDLAPSLARILHALSTTYLKAGRKSESDTTLTRAAAIARENLNKEPAMATIVSDYSVVLRNYGRTKEADELRTEVNLARAAASLVVRAHSPF